MARLLIHTGLHQCGGTEMQQLFHRNAALLERSGVLYPRFGPTLGHHPLAAAWLAMPALPADYRAQTDPDALWREVVDTYAGVEGTVILSAEALSRAAPDCVDFSDLARRVADFEEVRVLCCLRPQDEMMEALWAQSALAGDAGDPGGPIADAIETGRWRGVGLDYDTLIDRMAEGFGPERVVALDHAALPPGPRGLASAVLSMIDGAPAASSLQGPDPEPSILPLAVDLARKVGGTSSTPDLALAQGFSATLTARAEGRISLLSAAEYAACRDRFASGNARLGPAGSDGFWADIPDPVLFREGLSTVEWLALAGDLYRTRLSSKIRL